MSPGIRLSANYRAVMACSALLMFAGANTCLLAQTPGIAWTAEVPNSANTYAIASAMAPIPGGGVYLLGSEIDGSTASPVVARLEVDGSVTWRQKIEYSNYSGTVVAADVDGVVVAFQPTTGTPFARLRRFDYAGAVQWDLAFFGASITQLVIDSAGNLLSTSYASTGSGFTLRRISKSGQVVWTKVHSTGAANPFDIPNSAFVDTAGNLFVSGSTPNRDQPACMNACNLQHEMLSVKYDSNGNRVWSSSIGRGALNDTVGFAIVARADGGAIVAGSLEESGIRRQIVVALDATGQEVWRWRSLPRDFFAQTNAAVFVDLSGSVFVAFSTASGNPSGSKLIKLNQSGGKIWETDLSGYIVPQALFQDDSGSTYLTTVVSPSAQPSDSFLHRVDASGRLVWSAATTMGSAAVQARAGPNGAIIGGTTKNLAGDREMAAVKIDQSGQLSLALGRVSSRRSHGPIGAFDIELDPNATLLGTPTVDPRLSSQSDKLVFQFNQRVSAAGAVSGGLSTGGPGPLTASVLDNEVVVDLPKLPESGRYQVSLGNVDGLAGLSAVIAQFTCDINGNRAIGNDDVLQIRARAGLTPIEDAARFDVSRSGAVTATDIAGCKARVGTVF